MKKQGEKMEETRPRIRVAGILIEDDKILLIQHHKNNNGLFLVEEMTGVKLQRKH